MLTRAFRPAFLLGLILSLILTACAVPTPLTLPTIFGAAVTGLVNPQPLPVTFAARAEAGVYRALSLQAIAHEIWLETNHGCHAENH